MICVIIILIKKKGKFVTFQPWEKRTISVTKSFDYSNFALRSSLLNFDYCLLIITEIEIEVNKRRNLYAGI